jgi:SAM-dependent methyltransferase
MNIEVEAINECIACGSTDLVPVLDLGIQPLANSYKKNADDLEQYFPLAINRCKHCFHVQLTHRVNPDLMFKDYLYVSGTTKTQLDYFDWFADFAAEKYGTKPTTVLDIGCNDGTLLNFYPKKYIKFGIDPSDSLSNGNKNFNFIKDFFPSIRLERLLKNRKLDAITSIAMFYDLENPSFFVEKIYKLLTKEGIWIFEMSYMPDMIRLNSYLAQECQQTVG